MTRSVINFVHFNLSLRPIYMEAREAASSFDPTSSPKWSLRGSLTGHFRHFTGTASERDNDNYPGISIINYSYKAKEQNSVLLRTS